MLEKRRSVRNLVINPKLQREYAIFVVFVAIMMAALCGFTIWATVNSVLVAEYSPVGQERHLIVFDQVNGLLIFRLIIIFVIGIVLVYGLSLWYMHRVVGPIYRTHSILKQIAAGETPQKIVAFRKNDYFKEILPDLNKVIEIVRSKK